MSSLQNMAVAGIFFFLMGVCVKLLSDVHITQVVFFRGFIALIICIVQLKILKVSPWGKERKLLLLRGSFGTMAMVLYFFTLQKIPMSTALVVQYLAPFFVTLLASFLLGQKVKSLQWPFLACAIAGVTMIKGTSTSGEDLYILLGVLSAFFAACAYTCIGKIREREHPLVIIFYFPLVIIPLIAPFTYYYWVTPTLYQWGLLVLLGILVQVAQYFMTKSYQSGQMSRVAVVNYITIIYGLSLDIFIFEEELTIKIFIGIALIVFGVIGNTLLTYQKERV